MNMVLRQWISSQVVFEEVLLKLQFWTILSQLSIIRTVLAHKETAAFRMSVASELPL
jgi:hypothetical protein